MAPNANEETVTRDTGASTGGQFERETSGTGDYGCRGDYGSGRHHYGGRDHFESDSLERRGFPSDGERRGSLAEIHVGVEGDGPYGSYRGFYGTTQFGTMEGPHSSHGRESQYGYGTMDRFQRGPSGRSGYSRDHSPYKHDRFDSGPFGRSSYGSDFDRYGYRRDYGGRYGYGGDYGRDYGRSRYGYGRGFGDYGYGGSYGMGYGGSQRMYGYGGDSSRYSSGGGHGMYGYDGRYGRNYDRYGGRYGGDYDRYGGRYRGDYDRYGGRYGGDYGYYGSGRYGRHGYGGSYDRHGGSYGGGYGGRDSYDSFGRYGQGYGSHGYRDSYDPYRYNRGYIGKYGDDSDYSGSDRYNEYRRGYSDSSPYHGSYWYSQGPSGYSSYEYSPYRYGGSRYGYDRYHGGYRSPYQFGGQGRSQYERYPFDYDRFSYDGRDRYGRERYGSGYGGSQFGYGSQFGQGAYQGYKGQQFGYDGSNYGYRSGPYDGRGPYSRRQFDYGGQYGSHYGDHYGVPAPFPPFSQSRSYYPTSFEFNDEEEQFGKIRIIRAKEMAVRVNFDLQRRKFYENVTDSAQNPEFRISSFKRGPPQFPVDTLRVEFVDFLPRVNSKDHRTFRYELVQSGKPTSIFRRGQSFFMDITFQNRDFNPSRDCLFINFYLGPNPAVPKKTRIVLPVTIQKEFQRVPQHWDVRVHKREPGRLTLQIHIPSTTPIGCWHCVVETAFRHFRKARLQFRPAMNMYIIFNPFSPDDSTFMDNDDLRTEYLMNDSGKIFMGGFKSAKGRPWVYGQFDDCVLPVACVLLEMSKLAHSEWGNPAKVVRAISSMIKAVKSGSVDSSHFGKSNGVLVPRYEEDFRGGSSPHLWTGSVQIIEEFLKGGASPVKYGHCWIMAALMTTFCRAVGLSARPVTAFVAALNTQDTMTIDKYIDRCGDLMERGPGRDQPDSLWAFHTWCDIWMMRPDLPTGNSGWQACDPSRASRNAHEMYSGACGPCSSEAIRKGDIGFEKDTDAFYSLLNSYVRYFYEEEQSEWGFLPFMQFRFPLARYILTKAANRLDDEQDEDFEDVTALYKDLDIPQPEKFFIYNAFRGRTRDSLEFDYKATSSAYGVMPVVQEGEEPDVNFQFQEPVRIPLGEPLTLVFTIHNASEALRTIQANISCRSIFYTGVMGPHIKRVTGQFTLEASEGETLTLRIDPLEYQEKLIDMSFVKITVTGFVRETMQSFVDEFDFRFDKPKLLIEMPEECSEGKECLFELTFLNSLGMTLTECFVTFEINGAVRPETIQMEREVAPREEFRFRHSFVPRRQGLRHLVACFSSKQLSDVNGMRKVLVRD